MAETVIDTRAGNWKRHICEWLGHENIGVRNLLWGTPETLCLRCRGSAWTRPALAWRSPTTADQEADA